MSTAVSKMAIMALAVALLWGGARASAQTGASGDRVSLPEGPGSLEGIGEDVNVDPNMGLLRYQVPIVTPEGYPEMTPSLSLQYSSGAGSGVVGVGWDLATPSITRAVSRGLPSYTRADRFVADGGALLVEVQREGASVWRARHEGGFVRYTWVDAGEGAEGYWVAELPDGRKRFYGADPRGALVPEARVRGPEGTFRYHLVAQVDVWGHELRYRYRQSSNTALLERVEWVFSAGQPRYVVVFTYEDRPDVGLDARAGFAVRAGERLREVRVLSGGVLLQRYALSYEDMEASQGVSRLRAVERFGARGGRHPAALEFSYSRSLGGVCDDVDCGEPALVELGSVGVDLRAGSATLLDINGDALPDVVNTGIGDEPHVFYLNRLGVGAQRLEGPVPTMSPALANGARFGLRSPQVQALDVDGDGFTDLLNAGSGEVLRNRGGGDWEATLGSFSASALPPGVLLADNDANPGDGDLLATRFLDIDNDKRIDLINSVGVGDQNATLLYRNDPAGGFEVMPDAQPLEEGFEGGVVDLADLNGDGLLDPVRLGDGELSWQINLGRGRWAPREVAAGLPFGLEERPFVELEDLNNDGRADLVLVLADEVRYALGRGDARFGAPVVLNARSSALPLPLREPTTTVLFADMNGSGSTDIVWIEADGRVSYLELFPVQPHLLARITNGLGMVQEIEYEASVTQAARAQEEGQPWARALPHAMRVVRQVDVYELAGELHEVTRLRYRDGFYDGAEKSFRGYAVVEARSPGDGAIEAGLTRLGFDLGDADPYRAGLPLWSEVYSGGDGARDAGRLLQRVERAYGDCPVAELPEEGLDFAVRYVCLQRQVTVAVEGQDEAQRASAAVTLGYDGYGNVTELAMLGVTAQGAGGCAPCARAPEVFGAPCGPQCVGDERYTELRYISPAQAGGRWLLRRPAQILQYGRPGSGIFQEKRIYYDGEPFEGMALGTMREGAPTRIAARVDAEGEFVDELRHRVNAHGQVVEVLLPEGSAEEAEDHRFLQSFDEDGLAPTRFEYRLRDLEGDPYTLTQEVFYDALWGRPQSLTRWVAARGEEALTPELTDSISYDEFGRVEARFFAQDGPEAPSERVSYALGSPLSRVLIEQRSERGGAWDRQTARCFDGFGRQVQERRRLEEGAWQVSGLVARNSRGEVARLYSPYLSGHGECEASAPEGVSYQEFALDALRRPLRSALVSGEERLERRIEYLPLEARVWDAEDLDPASARFETPTGWLHDGLGRLVGRRVARSREEGDAFTFTYDELGRYRGVVDPEGNELRLRYDLAGRLVEVDDPDRGLTRLSNDRAGRPVEAVNARGVALRSRYDALGRLVETFDAQDRGGSLIQYRYDLPRGCPARDCALTARRLAEVSFPWEGGRGAWWYGYDVSEGRSFQSRRLGERGFDFRWRYDNLGALVERRFPDGRALGLVYDDARRLRGIEGVLDGLQYDAGGRVEALQLSNGVEERYQYDGLERLSGLEVLSPEAAALAARGLRYNKAGEVVEVSDEAAAPEGPSAAALYRYDALGRLVEASLDPERPAWAEVLRYAYDPLDNVTLVASDRGAQSPAHVGALRYGEAGAGPRAVTQAGATALRYSETGALRSKGEVGFQVDCFELPRQISDGQRLLKLSYGPGPGRVLEEIDGSRRWRLGDHYEVRDGVATILVDLGGRRLAELRSLALMTDFYSDISPLASPDGEITAGDAWASFAQERGLLSVEAARVDEAGALLQASLERLLFEEGEEAVWLHADAQGSVIAATGGDGGRVGVGLYYPFGLARGPAAAAVGFGDWATDPVSGFLNGGDRLYDPQLGRWGAPDARYAEGGRPDQGRLVELTGAYAGFGNNPTSLRSLGGESLAPMRGLAALSGVVGGGPEELWGSLGWARDQEDEGLLRTPDGREPGRYGIALEGFGGSAGGRPGYWTRGVWGLATASALGEDQGPLRGHARSVSATALDRARVRGAVTEAPSPGLGLAALGRYGEARAPSAAALGVAAPGGRLIAGGFAVQAEGAEALAQGAMTLGRGAPVAERRGERALAGLGVMGGLPTGVGGQGEGLGDAFEQRAGRQAGAPGGSAAGALIERAGEVSQP